MNYLNSKEEEVNILLNLAAIDKMTEVKTSGLPMAHDEKALYVDQRKSNNLVICSDNEEKNNDVMLPMLEIMRRANESALVCDQNSILYDSIANKFEESGYKIIKLDYNNSVDSSCYNVFNLPIKLVKEGNKSIAYNIIDNICKYVIMSNCTDEMDPFWINTASDYLEGIILYLVETKNSISFEDIMNVSDEIRENPTAFISKFDKTSPIYICLCATICAPKETMDSILSVFSQYMRLFISNQNLNAIMHNDDIDLLNIDNKKIIIFYEQNIPSVVSSTMISILVDEIYFARSIASKTVNKFNVLLDDIYGNCPIRDFAKKLNTSLNYNLSFTCFVNGYNDIINSYGRQNLLVINSCFDKVLYLLSNDNETLTEIENNCGKIITIDELRHLKYGDAVLLVTRMRPYKVELLPYSDIIKRY